MSQLFKEKDTLIVLLKLSNDGLKMKGIQSIASARDQLMAKNRQSLGLLEFFLVKRCQMENVAKFEL